MSSESSNAEVKSRTRSGGPRTARGKARSSQNSSKHKIFVHCVLPEEEEEAILLLEETREELLLNGSLELRKGRDYVESEFESRRIEKFAVQQFRKAQNLADLSSLEQAQALYTPLMRRPIPKEKEGQPGYCTRMRPAWCAMFLRDLRRNIEKLGPRPDVDMDYLSRIYGHEVTGGGEAIAAHYQMFIYKCAHPANEKTPEGKAPKYKDMLLDIINQEINIQEGLAALEPLQVAVISVPGLVVFPPDEVLDRIEKYRTANARKRKRLLEELQTIRDLKRKA